MLNIINEYLKEWVISKEMICQKNRLNIDVGLHFLSKKNIIYPIGDRLMGQNGIKNGCNIGKTKNVKL